MFLERAEERRKRGGHQDRPGREEGGTGVCGREEGKEEGGKKGGKRDRAIALQENFEKRKLMIGPHGGPRCFDFVAIRPFGCSEKVLSYTRTCKSAFYFLW